ncbi:MAG: alanine dehydrogenase [Phycisphaerae bacterium]|nr:MAG: alanine dehydrogenase [Phycisphaerae bacterium]
MQKVGVQKIGIRHEDKSTWERRIPLVPDQIKKLIETQGVPIAVQSSSQRAFSNDEIKACGAELTESLADCPVIIGVKEIPIDQFEKGKTYMFFSHTIKGQSYNMPMLKRMMELGCSLLDYERIVDDQGRRLVFFGEYAGLAGMIDTLWAYGQRLAVEGFQTSLSSIKPAHQYATLADAERHISEVGDTVLGEKSRLDFAPIVCGFSGYGRVSQGAQRIFDLLNPTSIAPDQLSDLSTSDTFCKVVFKECDMVEPIETGKPFDLQDYYSRPEGYRSIFEQYLPHLSMLVNCIYWEPKYPRLVTKAAATKLYEDSARPKLLVIGDISCDPNGSIEITTHATDPGNPVYVYDTKKQNAIDGFEGAGPVIMAVDILPTELPRESSAAFGEALEDLIPLLARNPAPDNFSDWELPGPLKSAVILHRGKLTPDHEYLSEYL